MGKMNGTWHSISMVVIIIFILAASVVINMTSSQYEAADPSEPSAVTINGRSASLLSGSNNLSNAFGNDYYKMSGCIVDGNVKLLDTTHGGITSFSKGDDYYYIYEFDPIGKYPDKCSIYNGVTTASTTEELEAAFGTDCIKTDYLYVEIFVDNKEVDYEIIGCPKDLDEWFEATAKNYPNAEYITILQYYYYNDDSPNHITFYIYNNNINTEEI